MAKRIKNPLSAWTRLIGRSLQTVVRKQVRAAVRPALQAAKKVSRRAAKPVRKAGLPASASASALAVNWHTGVALGPAGARRYALYRPPGLGRSEKLPLLVMLHGCGQDAAAFARCTGMNRLATRERCLVLYPEQERLANAQGCWNWFDTRSGRAKAEALSILQAIDQVCRSQPVDPSRVVIAGLSAGASMAALLVTLQPARFCALMMHSGVPPGSADSTLSALRAMRGRGRTAALAATPASMAKDWPALLVLQGSADGVVVPANGRAAVSAWADAAGAKAGPARQVQRGQRYPMTVTDNRCADGRTVATLVEVAGLGHAWSGGGAGQPFSDPRGPAASRLLWAFAVRQFRAPRRP